VRDGNAPDGNAPEAGAPVNGAPRRPPPAHGGGAPAFVEVGTVLILLLASGVADAILEALSAETRATTLLWLGCYVFCVTSLIYSHGGDWAAWAARRRSLFVVCVLVAGASVLWSTSPTLTLQRSVHLVGTTLIGCWLGYHVPLRNLLNGLTALFAVLVLGGAAAAVALPDLGVVLYDDHGAWVGLQGDKNDFGLTCAIAALFFACRAAAADHVRPARYLLLGLVALAAAAMSRSAASLGGLTVAAVLCLALYAAKRVRLPATVSAAGLVAAAIVAAALVAVTDAGWWLDLLGRSRDLTGRTEIWQAVTAVIDRHPWLGVGYGTLWFPRPGEEHVQQAILGTSWVAHHAHNGYLHIASELGQPVGLAALLMAILVLAESITLFLRWASPVLLFAIGLEIAILTTTVFEARLLVDRSLFWILFLAVPIAVCRSAERTGSWRLVVSSPTAPSYRRHYFGAIRS
jgi:hypothetical protein